VKKSITERTATSTTEQAFFIAPPPEFEISTVEATAISGVQNVLPPLGTIGDLGSGVKGEVPGVAEDRIQKTVDRR
jgi:hypothetical protein